MSYLYHMQKNGVVQMNEVTISIDRFEELIKAEARIEAVKSFISRDSYCNKNTILCLLGEGVCDDED